jgi:hypothetical protein
LENKILENEDTLKNIVNRLNRNDYEIYLLDRKDNSKIAIDDDLLKIIINYYKLKLI